VKGALHDFSLTAIEMIRNVIRPAVTHILSVDNPSPEKHEKIRNNGIRAAISIILLSGAARASENGFRPVVRKRIGNAMQRIRLCLMRAISHAPGWKNRIAVAQISDAP